MRIRVILAAAILGLLSVSGCKKEYQSPAEAYDLPASAENIKELGNGWHTFTLRVDGQQVTFLHKIDNEGGIVHYEAITALPPR